MRRLPRWCAVCGLLLTSLMLAACSLSSSPENTVETFYQAIAKKDVDKAIEQIALGDVPANEVLMAKGVLQMLIGGFAAMIENNDGIKRIEILETEMDADGQRADVRVKLTFNNGEEDADLLHLRLEDGKWKVVFR